MQYFEVAPTKIIRATSAVFTYCSDMPGIAIGSLVKIPVGTREHIGLVVRIVDKPAYPTKPILSTLPYMPIPSALVTTTLWMSQYYAAHLATVLQTVLPRGLDVTRRAQHKVTATHERKRIHFLLNEAQLSAIEVLSHMTTGSSILHGVTGSGKTAIYIELAKQSLADGKSVILLVPEIALTSQLVAEFQQHFSHIILTHSKQTESERHLAWQEALSSATPRIVIGPRSGLFMPLSSIGYIIIDEAHEPSFKQDQSPRYSTLRVASVLARAHNARVIQGTATPLISEYYVASRSHRPIVRIESRARSDATVPSVTTIDMTKKASHASHRFLSDHLVRELTESIENGEQALIFHNRRGSASTTLCEECGWSAICPKCFVPYTLHADSHSLVCHICGMTEHVPTSCPECKGTTIIHKGIGTKLIEAEVKKLFPKARIARFDGDAIRTETVEARYQDLYDGTIDIIIGTQVVAKGLDLPKLRLVGVIQADAGLALPDFAASERTFQLLSQVIGRVGRSYHKTSVIIQTYQPNSPAIRAGTAQDYDSFYALTLAERKRAQFPPFVYLLKLTCIYKTEAIAIRHAKKLAIELRQKVDGITILGPTPAFYERQHNTYRWQIIVKSPTRAKLIEALTHVPSTHWQSDLDATTLL
ncbi:primosomal protein N' [Candidatus Saccharibacteria bacterium]|nr:primosomal protein N' [Candidatus Saccharibacteria bacterium]